MRRQETTVYWLTGDSVENEIEWTLRCRVSPSSPGSYWNPPEDGDLEILSATHADQTMTGDEWVNNYQVSDDDLAKIHVLADEQIGDRLECLMEMRADARADLARDR